MPERKILQIIPAMGWLAKYTGKNEPDIYDPVVCFALVEEANGKGDKTFYNVCPMSWVDGSVEFCDEANNFDCLVNEKE